MSRKPKLTNSMRVRLDFVVELKEPTTSAPFGTPEVFDLIPQIAKAFEPLGISINTPISISAGLDYRHLKVTPEERTLMRRMLGLDVAKVAYRNRYCAPKDNVPPMLEALASRGLVDRGEEKDGQVWFCVSKVGIEVVTRPREREKENA